MKARDLQAGQVFRVVLRDGSRSLPFEMVELIRGHGGAASDIVRTKHRTAVLGEAEAHLTAEWEVAIEEAAPAVNAGAVSGGQMNLPNGMV